jgi:hypothetical protein
VISYIRAVVRRAYAASPPTRRTIAGAAAIAKPPRPPVSVIAESPMSGLASSGPKSPRNSPSASSAGAVNQRSPVPEVWTPKSVPLRAIVDDQRRAGDVAGGVGGELAGRHDEVEEEVVVAADEAGDLGQVAARRVEREQVGQQLAQQHERAGAVAVVALVAHLQHLGDERGDVHRPVAAHGLAEQRTEHGRHPPQPVEHLRAVRAVAQHLAQALVERAPRPAAVHRVLELEHPHRRADDARHRPDGARGVARPQLDAVAALEQRLGLLRRAGQALEQGRRRAAPRAADPRRGPT